MEQPASEAFALANQLRQIELVVVIVLALIVTTDPWLLVVKCGYVLYSSSPNR